MIEIKLRRTGLRWDFSFFAVLAVFFWLDSSGFGMTVLGLCAAHELAHLIIMCACGIVPESVTFYGAGIRITAPGTERCTAGVQAAVYSAGCLMNFLLAALLHMVGNQQAAAVSLATGLFNLLPVGEFDGRRLLKLLLTRTLPAERIDCALRTGGVVSALIFLLFFVFFRGASPTLIFTSVYILVMSLRKV